MVQTSPDFVSESTKFIYGPTQKTLRSYTFEDGEYFDVVLLDGPHGYPFPDFEYALLYERLREGSVLIIDDIHIPSIGNMFDTLRVDRMYDEVGVFSTTGVLRRTGVSGVPSDGDHWYEQQYNVSQFPLSMHKYQVDRSFKAGKALHFDNRQALDRYCGRGLEMGPSGGCIQTTDISATLRFDPSTNSDGWRDDLSTVVLNIEYKSIYEDASVGATITLGASSQALPFHDKFKTAQFKFSRPREERMIVTFLHPNAIPEHNRGNKRYEFRRLGLFIKSVAIELLSEVPKSSSHSWGAGLWRK